LVAVEATRSGPGVGTDVGTGGASLDNQEGPRGRRRRWWPRWWAALIAIVLIATAVAMVTDPSLVRRVTTSSGNGAARLTTYGGGLAPPISLPDLANPSQVLTLAQLRGRPVLVNFWASWCVPCRKEMPVLEAAYRRIHGRVAFLGVDTNDTRGAALSFLRQTGVTYPSVYDPHGTAAITYGLFGLPTTVFVAPNGRMIERHVGELSPGALSAGIYRLVHSASK
jgi:cytochrome c biogenesis protein CcmG/thiol:disulfide interchange protein DsbE